MDKSISESLLSDDCESARDGASGEEARVEQFATNRENNILIDVINQNETVQMESEVMMTKIDSRPAGNESSLKIKISTTLGRSWVNSTQFIKQNGESQIRNGNDIGSQNPVSDSLIATTSNNSTESLGATDINGHFDEMVPNSGKSDEESMKGSSVVTQSMNNVYKKLNCSMTSGKLLSHWEIMNKCLNKKLLFEALKDQSTFPNLYKCTVCSFEKNMPQHVLFHMRSHKDLTSAFELYQNYEQLLATKKEQTPPQEMHVNSSRKRGKKNVEANIEEQESDETSTFKPFSAMTTNSERSGNSSDSDYIDGGRNKFETLVKTYKRRRRRRKKKKRKQFLERNSAVTSGGSTTAEDSDTHLKKQKSITDFEASESDGDIYSRLRKRRTSSFVYVEDFISDSYDTHSNEIFDGMHYEDLTENVSADNPHFCHFCGMKFIRGNGIYRHYAKHDDEVTSQTRKKRRKKRKSGLKNGTVSTTCQTTLSYKINSLSAIKEKKENIALQGLQNLVNKVLEYLVKDEEVLMDLGWPSRNVDDLLIDILDRCGLAPVNCETNKLSKLHCMRHNAMELLLFCIKDEVMETNGWKHQLVDDVIKNLIAKIEDGSEESVN